MPRLLALAVALTCSVASAEPAREPTAAEVANAPLPGHESGRIDPVGDGDTTAREIGRAALLLPRWGLELALTPARAGLWLYDRYELDERAGDATAAGTMHLGFSPSVRFEDGFGITGVTAGGRLDAHDLFGAHEEASLQAAGGAGYYFRQLYAATATSGRRFGNHFSLALDTGYELRGRDAFYGLGNGPGDVTRYSQRRARASVTGDLGVWSDLHVRPSVAIAQHAFGDPAEGTSAEDRYMPVGWAGTESAYGELAVRWDSRHGGAEWDPHWYLTQGTLATAYAGRYHRLDAGTDFWRYGVDAQQLVRLGIGPRVLEAQFHGEAVTGSRDDVPFTDLPSLGGPLYLRGYAFDRFRDRVAVAGALEYRWDLARWIAAHVFVDAGRVYDSLGSIGLDHLRAGYGGGIEVGRATTMIDIASSIDGGLVFAVTLDPIHDLEARARRR
jgi:hypothetical protein